MAKAFALEGASVALIDWNGEAAQRVAAEINEAAAAASASRPTWAIRTPSRPPSRPFEAELGQVDILFNNAGIDNSHDLVDMPLAVWDEMITGQPAQSLPLHPCGAAGMKQRKWGPHHQHRLAERL